MSFVLELPLLIVELTDVGRPSVTDGGDSRVSYDVSTAESLLAIFSEAKQQE